MLVCGRPQTLHFHMPVFKRPGSFPKGTLQFVGLSSDSARGEFAKRNVATLAASRRAALGRITLSMLLLKPQPKVRLCKPLGKVTSIVSALVETFAKGQALQATGQSHIVHALVEAAAKGQALQAAGQSHINCQCSG